MHPERIKNMLHQEIEQADKMLLKMMYMIIKGYHSGDETELPSFRKNQAAISPKNFLPVKEMQ